MTLLNKATFLCLDCEFTGLDPDNDRILEIAAVRFTFDGEIDTFETLVNPQHPISKESQAVHNISPEMVTSSPKIGDVLPQLITFLGNTPIMGHAVNFDLALLGKEAERLGIAFPQKERPVIDTLRIARHYGDSPNNSLESLAKHFNIASDGAHRAMADVRMNIAVFKLLVQRFKTVEQVTKILSHPIQMKYMPLGKHKGRLFADIPLQYLQWAAHMDFDQDLLYSIRLELKKRKKGGRFTQASNPFTDL